MNQSDESPIHYQQISEIDLSDQWRGRKVFNRSRSLRGILQNNL